MKNFTRALAAFVLAAGMSTAASAQSVSLSTYSKMDFSKVSEKTTAVRTSRYFYAGYNTICLPFSVSGSDLVKLVGEGVMLEKLVKAEKGELSFMDCTEDGIEAGMPYLIYSPSTKSVMFSTTNIELTTEPKVLTVGEASMFGNFAPADLVDIFGIPAKQDTDLLQSILIRTEGDKTFLPTRCGIQYQGVQDVPVIKHITSMSGTETAIKSLQANNSKVDIYTPAGTLVKKGVGMNDAMSTLKSGIYVVNGLKFMVK